MFRDGSLDRLIGLDLRGNSSKDTQRHSWPLQPCPVGVESVKTPEATKLLIYIVFLFLFLFFNTTS